MKTIWLSTKANLYKMLHSKLVWIHILLPGLAAVIFTAYYMISPMQEVEKVKLYFQVLAITFPIMIAIVTTIIYEADLNAGGFQIFRMLSGNKAKGHIGNLLSLLLLGGVASLVAVMGFGVLFQGANVLVRGNPIFVLPISFYGKAACLLWGVNIAGYIIQYVTAYTFGKGVSLGLGIVGLLLSPLMYLGIGDLLWKWIPCSYGIRMMSYYVLKRESVQELLPYITNEYEKGGMVMIGVTLLCSALFCIWGALWQGARTNLE